MLEALLLCTVVGIADGDTLRARCATGDGPRTVSVRLAGIDSPEHGQPFGRPARRQLAALCLRERAEIRPTALDRYGRTVAHVTCRGADAGVEQVRAGMAWVFDRYESSASLHALQSLARSERRGLWADPAPVAPWEWRRQHPRR